MQDDKEKFYRREKGLDLQGQRKKCFLLCIVCYFILEPMLIFSYLLNELTKYGPFKFQL